MAKTAVVVGGGIAGLTLARDLARGGMQVTLLEAANAFGGKVARHTVAGLELDAGAESFANRRGTVADYAIELAIGRLVTQPNPVGAWLQPVRGNARPMPKTGVLGIPGTPLAQDVVDVIGFGAALRAQMDELMSGFVGSKEHNLGALVRKRMGQQVLDKLVTPVVMGIHSKHPDELDVDVVAPGLRAALLDTGSLSHAVRVLREAAPAGSAVSGLTGGMYELVEGLLADLYRWGAEVRTGARVVAVTPTEVTLDGGETLSADVVALATALNPGTALPVAQGSAPPENIVLATLVVNSPALDAAPRGTGLLVAPGTPGIRAKALTHATAKWPWLADNAPAHQHVLRLSYNDAPEGLEEQARLDAQKLLGVTISPVDVVGFARIGWAAPAERQPAIDGITIVGEGASGTGLAAVIRHARLEAERLLVENRPQ
jgi:oxygen-dependent protoporphyrinogen oxidase